MKKIAIVGAGLSGLTVANLLKEFAKVTLYEKSSGFGGRMATRRSNTYSFDHGAQFFKVTCNKFKEFISPMLENGIIQSWDIRFAEIKNTQITQKWQWNKEYPHYVGVPGMNAIAKYLSKSVMVHTNQHVASIERLGDLWTIANDQKITLGTYDIVIFAIPPAQACELLPPSTPLYSSINNISMQSCFALMLGFKEALELEYDAAYVSGNDISWISVNSTKPERTVPFSLLIHSTNKWANEHLFDNRKAITTHLVTQASSVMHTDLSKADHTAIHAWRYANISSQSGPTFIFNDELNLGLCGDWFIQGRVEAAFTSGFDLAEYIQKNIE